MNLANTAQLSSITASAFAVDFARLANLPIDAVECRIQKGLMPFLSLANQHPGQLLPSPAVCELLDAVLAFGTGELRSAAERIDVARPDSTEAALAAYASTRARVAAVHGSLDPEVWPEISSFAAGGSGYK